MQQVDTWGDKLMGVQNFLHEQHGEEEYSAATAHEGGGSSRGD
jgi:hypothetical protein